MSAPKTQRGFALLSIVFLVLVIAVPLVAILKLQMQRIKLASLTQKATTESVTRIAKEIEQTILTEPPSFSCKNSLCIKYAPPQVLCGESGSNSFPILDFEQLTNTFTTQEAKDPAEAPLRITSELVFVEGTLRAKKLVLASTVRQLIVTADIQCEELMLEGNEEVLILSATGSLIIPRSTGKAPVCPLAWKDLHISNTLRKTMPKKPKRKVPQKYSYLSALILQ